MQATVEAAEMVPAERLAAREWFRDARFGLFIHWGPYSQLGQGEWVMENRALGLPAYEWLASAFNPGSFDARAWVQLAKDAGVRYITITARHHDGFSMFGTKLNRYNIVDWTVYHHDPLRDLASECRRAGIKLFFYYSQLDWHHADYFPRGRTGLKTGRPESGSWNNYVAYMQAQLSELLTRYGRLGGIWLDGMWDRPQADWQLPATYALIHRLRPSALVIANHHRAPMPGEDVQTFEQDLPGANTTGFRESREVSSLPLETSLTMNNSWGFNITDTTFKPVPELIGYLVRAAGNGGNLLLNIGPRPDGTIQPEAIDRLRAIGKWLDVNGASVYGTRAGPVPPREWGVTTRRGDTVYVHVLKWEDPVLALPSVGGRVMGAKLLVSGDLVPFKQDGAGVSLTLPAARGNEPDRVVVLILGTP